MKEEVEEEERGEYIKGRTEFFLSVSKQLTREGQRRSRGRRQQYGNTEHSFIQAQTHR